eukprot:SAG31_NODE_8869_length_1370_cov_2.208497_3_plen_179_part_00
MPSVPSVPLTSSPLLQFGTVPIRLAALLLGLYLLLAAFPTLLYGIALVPANTMASHLFVWNVATAGFTNDSLVGVVAGIAVTLIVGKILENLWGTRELLRFTLIVDAAMGAATCLTMVILYASSGGHVAFLFDYTCGHCGLIGAYLGSCQHLCRASIPLHRHMNPPPDCSAFFFSLSA